MVMTLNREPRQSAVLEAQWLEHPTGFIDVIGSISSMDLTTVFHFSPHMLSTN